MPSHPLASLVVVVALLVAHRLRVRRVTQECRARHESRCADRVGVARGAHDALLQELQGLMFRLQAVRELLPAQPAKAVLGLDATLLLGEAVIDKAREAISRPRSPEDAEPHADAGRTAPAGAGALPSAHAERRAWQVVTWGRARQIAGPVLYALYRATQEAVDDAFRRERSAQITVEVRYGVDRLVVSIGNDRGGSNGEPRESARRPGDVALKGATSEIERLVGESSIRSGPHAGTRVLLSVPADVAYATASPIEALRTLVWWRVRSRIRRRG